MARINDTGGSISSLCRPQDFERCRKSSIREKAISQQYLSPQEEKALVAYVLRSAENGFPLPVKTLRQLALVIKRRRCSNGCLTVTHAVKPPGKNWARAFALRHPDMTARRLKAVDWTRADESIYGKVVDWFSVIEKELSRPDILAENVYNMDETGVILGQSATVKMLVHRKDRRCSRGTGLKRTLVTAIECISAAGVVLPPLIIWPASTHRSNWTTHPTPGWHFAYSHSGYTDKQISLHWIKNVFDPLTRPRAQGRPRMLINDGFATHESAELLEVCFENDIVLCRLPSHTSHKLQPLDIGVFGPLKTAYRDQVEQLYRGGAETVGKPHFTLLYSRAREAAFTSANMAAAWKKAGLVPFDRQHVLDTIARPHIDLALAPSISPDLPVDSPTGPQQTPVTSEAFAALRCLIEGETGHLNSSQQHVVEKALNAGEQALAKCGLLTEEKQILYQQNCEKKTRASVRSTVVGTARVMSYEDIIQARGRQGPMPSRDGCRKGSAENVATRTGEVAASRVFEMQKATQDIQGSNLRGYYHVFES